MHRTLAEKYSILHGPKAVWLDFGKISALVESIFKYLYSRDEANVLGL